MQISLQEVLSPVPGYETWDYIVYVIFALSLIGVLASGTETSPTISLFMAVILVGAVTDKAYGLGYLFGPPNATHAVYVQEHLNTYWTMLMRGAMFAAAAIATITAQKRATKLSAGVLTLIIFGYTIGRWFEAERGNLGLQSLSMIPEPHMFFMQGSLGVSLLIESGYRFWRCRINRL
ncbi:MAG: hypothetical protein L0154_14575 [Chloroflexi bacterium]|nr:hypothetical protein [Chloroflexota bacterium]